MYYINVSFFPQVKNDRYVWHANSFRMAFDMYEVYFQIFTVLATVHVVINVVRCVVSMCENMDRQNNIDGRLDVLENEFLRLIAGEYAVYSRNTITQVSPSPTNEETDDESDDTEKED